MTEASAFAGRSRGRFVGGDVGGLPFSSASFDIVISDDGFDHFREPDRVLAEMARVLEAGGTAFISFVPYFNRHCSHMDELLRLPWHHVLFPPATIREALGLAARARGLPEDEAEKLAEGVFHNFRTDLSRLTLRGFFSALRRTSDLRLIRARRQAPNWRRPLAYLPGLSEPFVDSIHCVFRKEEGARISRKDIATQLGKDMLHDARVGLGRLTARLRRR